jgi:hypothetical protein
MPAYAAAIDPSPRLARNASRASMVLPRGWHAEATVRFDQFDEDCDSMRFDADVVGASRLFLHSTVLFDAGEELYVSFPLPGGSRLEAKARVTDCDCEAAHCGMELRLSASAAAA